MCYNHAFNGFTLSESKQAITRPFSTWQLLAGWANLHSASEREHVPLWNSRHTSSVSHFGSRICAMFIAIATQMCVCVCVCSRSGGSAGCPLIGSLSLFRFFFFLNNRHVAYSTAECVWGSRARLRLTENSQAAETKIKTLGCFLLLFYTHAHTHAHKGSSNCAGFPLPRDPTGPRQLLRYCSCVIGGARGRSWICRGGNGLQDQRVRDHLVKVLAWFGAASLRKAGAGTTSGSKLQQERALASVPT